MINTPYAYASGSSLANTSTGSILPYFNAGGSILEKIENTFRIAKPSTSSSPLQGTTVDRPAIDQTQTSTQKGCNCGDDCPCKKDKKNMHIKHLALLAAGVAIGYFIIK